MNNLYRKINLLFLSGALCTSMAAAQQVLYKEKPLQLTKHREEHFDEKSLRERMAADGLPSPVINKLVEQHRQMWAKGMHIEWTRAQQTSRNGNGNHTCAICSDMSAENGWGAWQGAVGSNSGANPPVWGSLGAPNSPNFNLMTGPGIDPCTPGFNPGDPPLPVVARGFGSTSIELGESQTAGSITEQLTYPLTVAVTDTNFIYAYALVLEDAGHNNGERPYAEFVMLNPAGDTIPCAFFHYEGAEPNGAAIPGFYQGTCGAKYKPWTTVGVNLSGYVGQTVTLIITNADCIWGAHFAQSYWDFNCGILQGSSTADCNGVSDTLQAPVDPSIVYGYLWYPGGQTTQSIVVTPMPGDTFTVEIQPPTGCNFYETFVPQVGTITPSFTFNGSCGIVNFHDASSTSNGTPIVAWHWSFPGGNPATSALQNPVVHYSASGNFTATLTITTASGCTSTISSSGTNTGIIPIAAFTTTDVCLGSTMPFVDHSTADANDLIAQWNWDFGDGTTSGAQNPSHLFGVDSTYEVTLTVTTSAGCSSSIPHLVTIHPIPVAGFSVTIVCEGSPTLFTDLSTGAGLQWHWNLGDGNVSSVQNPSHTYANSGNFTAQLLVTNSFGCIDSIAHSAIVNPQPFASFNSNGGCAGSLTNFTDLSSVSAGSITSWNWDFGDGTVSGAQNPSHLFAVDSTYVVTLTVAAAAGCSSIVAIPVIIHPLPVAVFTANIVCQNYSTIFTNQSTGAGQWLWTLGDGDSSLLQNPTHIYNGSGNFTVNLLAVTSFGCRDSITQTIHINPQPVSSFSVNRVCVGDSSCFTDLSSVSPGGIVAWNWDFGDVASGAANTSNLQSPCHVFTPFGTFNPVQLTVTSDSGCVNSSSLSVTFYELPVASFTSTANCLNVVTNFTDGSSATTEDPLHTWNWDFGDSTNHSSQQNPVHLYSSAGWFNTTLVIITNHGCKDTITNQARVYDLPSPEFSDSAQGCTPICSAFTDLTVTNDGTIANWEWTFASGNPSASSSQNPNVCYSIPGSYNVSLIVTTNYGCKDTLMKPHYINVYELPHADFCIAPDTASLLVPAFNFCDLWTEDVANWQWDFGDGSDIDSTHENPAHSYSSTIDNNTYYSYTVTVYVQTVHGCRDSISHKVELTPDFSFFIPNTFTPNGDRVNDFFYGKGRGIKDYTISIYDRWGILLWTCHEDGLNTDWDRYAQDGMPSGCQWDGRLDANITNERLQNDVYVWRVRLTTIFGEEKTYIGHVSAVK